jgi:hypothetical protein
MALTCGVVRRASQSPTPRFGRSGASRAAKFAELGLVSEQQMLWSFGISEGSEGSGGSGDLRVAEIAATLLLIILVLTLNLCV